MPKSPCLKIPKKSGEKTIQLARQLDLFNHRLKIEQKNNLLCIPLSRVPDANELKTLTKTVSSIRISVHNFALEAKSPKTFVDVLTEELPPHLIASLPRAADFVGDIAVIEVPPELERYKQKIGQAIMTTNRRVLTVLAKASAITGVYRTREFEAVAGEKKTATVHKEHGCVYHVDLSKAYFSPRLSSEHLRVANLVKDGEKVIDMFTGVGPFAVQIAKQHKKVRVFAVDINVDAIELLNKNIDANRVADRVVSIQGDIRQIVRERLSGVADRVVMNLPERAIEYVDAACEAIEHVGGIMHYYEFTNASDPTAAAEIRLVEAVEKAGRKVEKILGSKTVRATSPYTWQVVVDTKIK